MKPLDSDDAKKLDGHLKAAGIIDGDGGRNDDWFRESVEQSRRLVEFAKEQMLLDEVLEGVDFDDLY